MDLQFFLYLTLFVIFGVPLVGFAVRNLVRFGSFLYKKYPFLQKFFDEYYEHFALGAVIVVIASIMYGLARWMDFI
jgi:hypothetical protein